MNHAELRALLLTHADIRIAPLGEEASDRRSVTIGVEDLLKIVNSIEAKERARGSQARATRDSALSREGDSDDAQNAPYRCLFCGVPSWVEPSDQRPPPDYCHEEDHGTAKESLLVYLARCPKCGGQDCIGHPT